MIGRGLVKSSVWLIGVVGLFTLAGCGAQERGGEVEAEERLETGGQALDRARQGVPAGLKAAEAWRRFVKETGGSQWQALVNPKTGVPQRIYGQGLPAVGSVANEATAEAFARAFLARHIELLAPGAAVEDFVLASNHLSGGIRSVGFFQHADGLRVLTGQVSFRFKNDRLFVIASEAQPNVAIEAPARSLDAEVAQKLARDHVLAEEDEVSSVGLGAVEGPFVLPVDGGHRVVTKVVVSSAKPMRRWDVFLDARDGAPVHREQTLMFESATVKYNAPLRGPSGERRDWAATMADVDVSGDAWSATDEGLVEWVNADSVDLLMSIVSDRVRIHTEVGEPATKLFEGVVDGDELVWNAADDELVDAQLNTFIHLNVARNYAKMLAPDLRWLNQQVEALVNIDDECNAVSDGTHVYFFQSSRTCENTGRIADVVYHEFGHSLHNHAVIPGVGAFDGSLSEGVSDYLASTITGDPGMGPDFFKGSSRPLRHIDPAGGEYVWPNDYVEGDVHSNGLIISGALWDLRKALIAKYGEEEGIAQTDRMYLEGIRRASDIPTMYVEVLAADDDDGDLNNGTPNLCDIVEAFSAHGLASLGVETGTLKNTLPSQDGFQVTMGTNATVLQCLNDTGNAATITWRLRDNPSVGGEVAMESDGAGVFAGWIPAQEAGAVVQYNVTLNALGASRSYPDNPADPLYEFYVGEVKPIYCTSFDEDPVTSGWVHGLAQGEEREGADDWQWGPAGGKGYDPPEAYSPPHVFGNDIGPDENWNGVYQSNKVNYARSPRIDTTGYSHVRLQYMRWLTVEDATYDTATIYANDQVVWQNAASEPGDIHHIDREWRFHDVDLTDALDAEGGVEITYEIASDGGLELGGWNLDDFCVVGIEAVCGDGMLSPGEACDDGNTATGDGCDAACVVEPGTGLDDIWSGDEQEVPEQGDGGLLGDPGANVTSSGGSGGCSQVGSGGGSRPVGAVVFALLGLIVAARRR